METLPPSGLAHTLPPAPSRAAARGLLTAATGLLLLCGALSWGLIDAHDTSQLFVNRELDFAMHTRRIMYGVSLAAILFATKDQGHGRDDHPWVAGMVRLIAFCWMLAVIWAVSR
jgi:hypothetical protein